MNPLLHRSVGCCLVVPSRDGVVEFFDMWNEYTQFGAGVRMRDPQAAAFGNPFSKFVNTLGELDACAKIAGNGLAMR